MATSPTGAAEQDLIARAGSGDETAFEQLVQPFRGELHAHCYRMLGSVYDAEDALQEAMLRAWRAMDKFEGRSSLRSWLYTICTNTCLNHIAKRPKRVLPVDYGPSADPHDMPGAPIVETVWLEPYPDEMLGLEDGRAAPEARFEQREGVELAFIAALQHLPANQRGVLILREVLGFSAKEVADQLETSVPSVNSALQRARAAVDDRVPDQSQQKTLRAVGDDEMRELVDRYVDAWERQDIDQFVSMLAEDATFTMPPLASWYEGREGIEILARNSPLSGEWHWRAVVTRANGQPALGFYSWDENENTYLPFALNILSFRGREIVDVTAFIVRATEKPEGEDYGDFPTLPADEQRLTGAFGRFGLPERLDGPAPTAR